MTEPPYPAKIAVKPVPVRPHARPVAKEPLHLHKRHSYSLGAGVPAAPAVENDPKKD